jgi:Holliday junction resolvase RusA-like endonuclease
MPSLSFFVEGHPKPAGSKRALRRGDKIVVFDMSGAKGKAWRRTVAERAVEVRSALDFRLLTGPIKLDVVFHLPRPKRHYDRQGSVLPAWRDEPHVIRPDTTKLLRSLEDALTGVLWKDDAQIVHQWATKCYARRQVGADVSVRW